VKPRSEDTLPGDAIGHDSEGHVRISRTIPLNWIVGGLIVVAGQAIAMYYGVQRLNDAVKDIQIELKAINLALVSANTKGVEHGLRLTDIERRIGVLEELKRSGK